MDKTFKIFHYASFLQYPFIIAALYYTYRPLIIGMEKFDKTEIISNYNLVLLFFGIAFSFTSLADITKRTKLGNKILPLICLITTIILLLVPGFDVTEIKIPCLML